MECKKNKETISILQGMHAVNPNNYNVANPTKLYALLKIQVRIMLGSKDPKVINRTQVNKGYYKISKSVITLA